MTLTRPSHRSTGAVCIFDLDGTLVDSLRDIAESVNECLELLGLTPLPVDRYRYLVGEGIPRLCHRAIGETHPHSVNRLIELSRAHYRTRCLRHTRPYDGVPELVSALRRDGVALAVLSNKPHDMTMQIVRNLWPDETFAVVQGLDRDDRRKPDPTHALAIHRRLGGGRGWGVLVGDTPTDIATAQNAGLACIAVTWGFRSREDLLAGGAATIADRPAEVYTAIREAIAASSRVGS